MNLFTTLMIGFILGIKHAIEPDHVIAVSTIVSRTKKLWTSSLVGIFWGIGHTLTLLIFGMLFIFMKKDIPNVWALSLEFAVGIMLVYLGIRSFISPEKNDVHSHSHEQENSKLKGFSYLKSIFIGAVHGLSGSAAMILLTMSTVKSPWEGGIYIIIFGIGTIFGMLLFTTIIGMPFAISSDNKKLNIGFTRITAVISCIFGVYYMYNLGINDGLFKLLIN
ncbi:urease accessory protein UreH domain-containing protein [Oceanirhabdus sp. W0125-5]|uniref:urease accessory protein UreH domain-containing protein n=1 Tax=Oceanirhabdus sp. W0125-5 TaxID=2999116 RepID=UPI0022F2B3B7|nr:sulfite exporter TauE/SafE family protein [Oceanirhabdus sp. W0125-5]WBW95050.1 sulfite exporter TauE/SafE family protein [Oceanirhabdus sp. W0125-5]